MQKETWDALLTPSLFKTIKDKAGKGTPGVQTSAIALCHIFLFRNAI